MRPPPLRSFGRVPLRWHLVVLVTGALLPVVAFAAVVVLMLSSRERAADERRLLRSARTLATAVDREMSATIRTLQVMAESEHLERGDLAGFHAEAQRAHGSQPTWLFVIVLAPDGQMLASTGHPFGAPLPTAREPDSLRKAVETRQPVVGDLARGKEGGLWGFPVRVPILRDGAVRYVLTAVISPRSLAEVVGHEPLPDEWTRAVVDGRGVIAARSRAPELYVGQPGAPAFLSRIREAGEGLYRDTSIDGADIYVAFSRAPTLAWTAAVGVPTEIVDGPLRRSLLAVGGAGLLLVFVSGAGAFVFSRRLSRGIASATAAAEALAHGEPPRVEHSSVEEVAHLGDALARSAELLSRRERERDEHLARAEAARAEAEAANREKDEFLAMLGHELRNPLSPIVTALELLRLRGQAGAREHDIIRRQVEHLVRLVDDLLDVSRITRGKIELRRERIEISGVIARAVEMARPLVDQRGHALEVEVPEQGIEVHGDPVRLAQVLANLLTNAARYTSPGGHIRLEARREGGSVVITVTDDGEGIPAEVLPRVFDLFVQAPRSLDRQQGGLGIGLTLVRSLVALHGGRVEARSEGPGRGSEFIVTLPALERAGAAAPQGGASRASRPEGARPLRVLIVDDNVEAAELLGELLAAHRCETELVHDGPAALEVLDRFTPDVALLDIGLPIVDGYTLAGQIREKLGPAAPIFVAVTGYGQEQDRTRSRAAGFHRHFAKPVDVGGLLSAIEELAASGPSGPIAR